MVCFINWFDQYPAEEIQVIVGSLEVACDNG